QVHFLSDPGKLANFSAALTSGSTGAVSLNTLCTMPLLDLLATARSEYGIDFQGPPVREQLIDRILDAACARKVAIEAEGILETTEDGYGLLVFQHDDYRIKPTNAFVPRQFVRKFGLKRGTILKVQLHPKRKLLPPRYCRN
ncbi:MAG: hypothetical protein LR015_13340, partial [Verrucomicrobia bacterium]|nr:hypothetical protein [Verrucomicrobiota bacterium]